MSDSTSENTGWKTRLATAKRPLRALGLVICAAVLPGCDVICEFFIYATACNVTGFFCPSKGTGSTLEAPKAQDGEVTGPFVTVSRYV